VAQPFYVRLPPYVHLEASAFEPDAYRAAVDVGGAEHAVPATERVRHTIRWRRSGVVGDGGEQEVLCPSLRRPRHTLTLFSMPVCVYVCGGDGPHRNKAMRAWYAGPTAA
jgi:hypothetical protein